MQDFWEVKVIEIDKNTNNHFLFFVGAPMQNTLQPCESE